MKRLISLVLLFTFAFPVISLGAQQGQGKKPLMLHVEGNRIVNELGETVRLIGANAPSMGWSNGEATLEESIIMAFDNWNANIIRLCLSQKFWYGNEWYIHDGGLSYRKRVDDIVKLAYSRGKYVILDLHEYKVPNVGSKRFWNDVSSLYKNNPAVLFGLLNEPHDISWEVWRNGGPVIADDGTEIISPGHQGLLNIVRENGAKNIVIAGGLDWAYDLRGITKGYDGKENGYALEEPPGNLKGNGIVYDAHIYPLKGLEDDWEEKVGCAVKDYPVLVGEFGHFGDRLADWYDFRNKPDPAVWMNQILNWIDKYNLNYTAWNMHTSSSPCMISDWTYKPTPYSGIYQKFHMLSQPDTRPEIKGVQDQYPLYTWKKVIDFDKVAPQWGVYKFNNAGYFAAGPADGLSGKGTVFAFDTPKGSAGAIADFPKDWNLSGASSVWFKIKGDGDIRNVGVGLELNDGRQFKMVFPLNLYKGWQTMFFPLACFKGEYGTLDTTKIKSVFFTSESDGPGSFTIDDFTIAGHEYAPPEPFQVTEDFQNEKITWDAWPDNENSASDSFTTKLVKNGGHDGTAARQFWFVRPAGSFGGQARGVFPASWNLENAKYMSFWIKGSGDLNLLFRLEKNNQRPQKSNFNRRDLGRFCLPVKVKGTDWQKVVLKIADFGISEDFELEKINALSIFNMDENAKGNFTIDDLTFTNQEEPLKERYDTHPMPQPTESITTLPKLYPDNVVVQSPTGEYRFKAGQEASMYIDVINKTDRVVIGLLKIDQIPDGFYLGLQGGFALYKALPGEKTTVRLSFTPPADAEGQYKITVVDTGKNGCWPLEYLVDIEK